MPSPTKKIVVSSELAYVLVNVLLSFAIAMVTTTDFGVSMVVAPAYILSLKVPFLTFGQAEYVIQGLLFLTLCLILKKIRLLYFFSFSTCLFYGALLDFWRTVIPVFNPDVFTPGSLSLPVRIVFFVIGTTLSTISIALVFRIYIYPQVYEFFVMGVSAKFGIETGKVKIVYDVVSLSLAIAMTLLFFGRFEGIGIGTVVSTAVNGQMIRFFGNWMDKHFEIKPSFPKFAELFSYQ